MVFNAKYDIYFLKYRNVLVAEEGYMEVCAMCLKFMFILMGNSVTISDEETNIQVSFLKVS